MSNCDTFNDVNIDLTINKNIFHFNPPAGGKAGCAGGAVGDNDDGNGEQKPCDEDQGQSVIRENMHKEQHQPFQKGDS